MNDVPELAEIKRKANTRSLKEMALLLRYLYMFCLHRSKLTWLLLITKNVLLLLIIGVLPCQDLVRMLLFSRTMNVSLSLYIFFCLFFPSFILPCRL